MQLTFGSEHISIRQFDPISLPDFTILTGRNGSGKTHLLQAIQNGKCSLDDFQQHEIQYFNFQSFFVPNSQGPIPVQMQQLTDQGFAEYQQHWLPQIQQIFANHHDRWKPTVAFATPDDFYNSISEFWTVKPRNKQIGSVLDLYRVSLNDWLNNPANIARSSQYPAIWSMVQKCGKSPHLLDRETFNELFVPIQNAGSVLGFSLSTIFSKFVVDEFNWTHNEFEAGRSASKNKSSAFFRSKRQPPWIPINKLLDEMGKMSGSKDTFRFEITTPDDNPIRIQDVQNYTFIANLKNKLTGDICNFDHLSSGEKVLLALVVSIYYSNETFKLPRALLLDEIDASLHPSMIRMLLSAIESAFVSKGAKVILATHSPTTVALAPECTLHSVQSGRALKKVIPTSKRDCLALLTEGFATFDEGLEALRFSGERLVIFTEGGNRKILKRFFEISGIEGIKFV
jgi:predicted ATPase